MAWLRAKSKQACQEAGSLAPAALDGLPVPEAARHVDRTLQVTEALLARARAAFRRIYEGVVLRGSGDRVPQPDSPILAA